MCPPYNFYLHEVELKEKLADVFTASQQGTSTSSKSIIAYLINKFNPDAKKHEGVRGVEISIFLILVQ